VSADVERGLGFAKPTLTKFETSGKLVGQHFFALNENKFPSS
jgi:hypothetical protein